MSESGDKTIAALKTAALIPAYREEGRIGRVVAAATQQGVQVIVIDDGSRDQTAREAEAAGARVLRHEVNKGKGAALQTGFAYARAQGFQAVITLDADGQHDPLEISKFVEAFERTGIPVLIGNRMGEPKGMPLIRRWTNQFMSWMLSREMGQYVPDTQCGFRLFRCDVLPYVASSSQGFAAESEALLHLSERGIRIASVRVSSIYGDEKSKIHPIPDTVRFFAMILRYRRRRRALRRSARTAEKRATQEKDAAR